MEYFEVCRFKYFFVVLSDAWGLPGYDLRISKKRVQCCFRISYL